MAYIVDTHRHQSIPLAGLLELGRDYCSEQLGRFFQNNYSLPVLAENKFEIPAKLATRGEQDCFAICVMMNNHIVDLKYFDDLLIDWDKRLYLENKSTTQASVDINQCINDPRLLNVIKRFKKINDEILIGRCRGLVFTAR